MVRISSSVHTRIENSLGLRKDVLETELKAVELLQKLKKYKKENEEKKDLIAQFKKNISSVRESIHRLEFEDLPTDMKKEKRIEEIIVKPQRKMKEKIEEEIAQDELSQEVWDLKEKIESLRI